MSADNFNDGYGDIHSPLNFAHSIRLSGHVQALLWTTSLIAGLGAMFSVTIFYYPETYKYTVMESALYAGLHRLGWSYFTGWIVLACVTGYAGESNKNTIRT